MPHLHTSPRRNCLVCKQKFSDENSSQLFIIKCGHVYHTECVIANHTNPTDVVTHVFVCPVDGCGTWSAYGFLVRQDDEKTVLKTNTQLLRETLTRHVAALRTKGPHVYASYSATDPYLSDKYSC